MFFLLAVMSSLNGVKFSCTGAGGGGMVMRAGRWGYQRWQESRFNGCVFHIPGGWSGGDRCTSSICLLFLEVAFDVFAFLLWCFLPLRLILRICRGRHWQPGTVWGASHRLPTFIFSCSCFPFLGWRYSSPWTHHSWRPKLPEFSRFLVSKYRATFFNGNFWCSIYVPCSVGYCIYPALCEVCHPRPQVVSKRRIRLLTWSIHQGQPLLE